MEATTHVWVIDGVITSVAVGIPLWSPVLVIAGQEYSLYRVSASSSGIVTILTVNSNCLCWIKWDTDCM